MNRYYIVNMHNTIKNICAKRKNIKNIPKTLKNEQKSKNAKKSTCKSF